MTGLPAQFNLTGRRALITGAGAGLGRAFALAFAEAGAHIIAADRALDRAEETAALVAEAGGSCDALHVDVADPASVQAMAEDAAAGGDVHVLVNNAGIANEAKRVHEMPVESWNEVIAINLNGVFYCSRAIIPLMLAAGGGAIVNLASIAALVGLYRESGLMVNSCYAAAKAGVVGLTRQTAAEYAKDGIRANAIAPGWHGGTRLSENNRRDLSNAQIAGFEDAILAGTPMGRRGTPEELAPLALYLASDASSYVTGQVFTQDGGWTAI